MGSSLKQQTLYLLLTMGVFLVNRKQTGSRFMNLFYNKKPLRVCDLSGRFQQNSLCGQVTVMFEQ